MRASRRRTRVAAYIAIAGVGGWCGLLVSSATVKATICYPPTWRTHLQSVTSSDPSINHTPFWPQEAAFSRSFGTLCETLEGPCRDIQSIEMNPYYGPPAAVPPGAVRHLKAE